MSNTNTTKLPMYGIQFADGSYLSSPVPSRTTNIKMAAVIARDEATAKIHADRLGGTVVRVG